MALAFSLLNTYLRPILRILTLPITVITMGIFLLVINAANIAKDLAWLRARGPQDCALVDRSDDLALLALQGPRAESILAPLTTIDLGRIAYYHFAEGVVDGHPASVSRTGYTGEDGFEVVLPAAHAADLWHALVAAGVKPAGLISLHSANLDDNQLTNLTVAAGLTQLGWLGLSGNQFTSFTVPAELTSLRQIRVTARLPGLANFFWAWRPRIFLCGDGRV